MRLVTLGIAIVLALSGCASPDYRDVILDSYETFEEQGVTERLTNEEGDWVIVFDPSRAEHQSAWFDLEDNSAELITEADYFSVYLAYLMMNDRGLKVTNLDTGFALESKNWPLVEFEVERGLIIRARAEDTTKWQAEIRYGVEKQYGERLRKLEREAQGEDFETS
jgi:hypothetical protein